MTWMTDLYQTYENNRDQVGNLIVRNGKTFSLLPVGHAYRNAQIEVTVTDKGEFYDARVLSKDEAPTIIPVTEASSGRTSKAVPHPLHDNLKYVAGDYEKYVEKEKNTFSPYELYMDQLKNWATENPRINAVYIYLKKETLIRDLIANGELFEKNGKLIPKWTKEIEGQQGEKPEIFKVIVGEQGSAFVRFTVHKPNQVSELPLWEDVAIYESAIDHFFSDKKGLDYVTGKNDRVTDSHTSSLRYAGDMAKLISANDETNFTFRGRFLNKSEVAEVGYDISQKAHNALKWLIAKQGIIREGRVFLIWGDEITEPITPLTGGNTFAEDDIETSEDPTQEEYTKLIKAAIYQKTPNLSTHAKVHIMILDNATSGRLSILYYNSMDQMQYLSRIEKWHLRSMWRNTFYSGKKWHSYYGAPGLHEIVQAALGERANKKVLNNTVTALFTCVVEGRTIPSDILRNLVHRSSNPQSFENEGNWRKAVQVTCSMINNYYQGGYQVSLNQDSKEPNYLFGRLLAVSHVLEKHALNEQGAKPRSTNAERYMNAYSMHPVKTWQIIRKNLQPYMNRLGHKTSYYEKIFSEIMNQFDEASFTDKPLDGRYLLGFYSQEYAIYHKEKQEEV